MKNTRKFLLALFVATFLVSCTNDWLDINKDPNSPTTPELSQLLSGSEYYMTQALSQGDFIGDNLSSYVHYTVSREVQNYGMGTQANNPYNTWNYLYTYALQDYDAIINSRITSYNVCYTKLLRDPGYLLVKSCLDSGVEVECLPGATALIPALVNSGLPSDRFCFEGFLPQSYNFV